MSGAFLVRWRAAIVAVALSLAAFLGLEASRVGIEHDNESLRSTDPETLQLSAEFRDAFGGAEDILVALGHPDLLGPSGLSLLADLTSRIAAVDGVARVWSLSNAEEIVRGEAGPLPKPLLESPDGEPIRREVVAAALDRNPDFTGWLVSADRRSAGLVVQLDDRPGDVLYRSRVVAALRAMRADVAARGGELHLTGIPVQKIDVSECVDRDQRVLMPAAVVVLGLVLAVFFRHVSGVLVPLATAGATVLCTLGAYGLAGHSLNAITALLPPVMLVVALASTVHVYDAWLAGEASASLPDRAARAVRAVLVPSLLCTVTTAQGFLSLRIGSDLPAVGQFGVFAALGTAVAFVVASTVVPAVLSAVRPPRHRVSDEHGWTLRFLDRTSRLSTSRPWTVLAVFAAITVVLAAGIPRLRSNTDLVGFLKPGAPLRIDTEWIDAHLTGTLPVDFLVRRHDGAPVDTPENFARLEKLEEATVARDGVAGVTSIVALLRQVGRADRGDGVLALPAGAAQLHEALDLLDESGHAMVRRFAAPEMKALRLSVRLHGMGSAESAPLVEAIEADARRRLGPGYDVRPTGPVWEVVRDSEKLVRQQVASFGSAIVLVVAAIGLLMRSWTFTLVAMIPNVMPILWTGGLMGWTGIELSTGTAMIASAVLGLVVDDTIHYLNHYRHEPDDPGGGRVGAILATSRAVGAPVTVMSVSLVLGFWVGALGSFRPTIYFSLLTGLTMITGVLCDLLVLPACLLLLDRASRRRAAR